MSGVRFDRFLASTAVVLLLAAAPGAMAEQIGVPGPDMAAPEMGTPSAGQPEGDSKSMTAKPDDTGKETAKQPSSTPDQTSPQPTSPMPAAAEPAAAAPSTGESATPAATAGPAEKPQPAAATDTAPSATATAPAAATPVQPSTAANPTAANPTAASPPPAPATATDLSAADAAVAEQLRELANGKFDRILGDKKERVFVDAFYSGRDYAPLWITDGKPNARANAAIAYLRNVDADGLDPVDYPVPNFATLTTPAALAEGEMRLTRSVLTYAHHAEMGRVHWSRVSGDIFYDQTPPDAADVLADMVGAKDVAEALDAYEPHAPGYLALKAKLAEIRAGKGDTAKAPISGGPTLRVGMQDDRVPQLRERLGLTGDGRVYDKALAEAVKSFQREHELKATGTLNTSTVEALNGRQPDRPTDIIIANMERWRWMPHDLGKTYVMVNLPDFTLHVIHNSKEVWQTKIVDGKPALPTPIMSAEMKYITVNPTWNVPPSIVAREYMPALQQDSTVLERMGLRVTHNPDGTIHISQPPGDRNALGRLRFNFPNKFLVYQHDTPEKHLFAFAKRAFSHGCMRVQDPVKYAEVLLSIVRPGEGYTQDRIRRMFGNNETDIQFPKFVPVHLTYQTAFVDESGRLVFREDVYGRDKALLAILKGDERKVADIPIERKENPVRRAMLALPDQGPFWGHGFGDGGFFGRLFGSSYAAQPPASGSRRQRRTERQPDSFFMPR